MKKLMLIIFIPFYACSQPLDQEKEMIENHAYYREIVKSFYSLLNEERNVRKQMSEVYLYAYLDTGVINEVNQFVDDLTFGQPVDSIKKIIDKSVIFDDGLQFAVYMELSFSETERVFFELGSKDRPSIIQHIWLSDGSLLSDRMKGDISPQSLLLVGVIRSETNFVDVRETPSKSSHIINKLTTGELFYYTPDSEEWWVVSKIDGNRGALGYIHKKEVIPYYEMTLELKRKVVKLRNSE